MERSHMNRCIPVVSAIAATLALAGAVMAAEASQPGKSKPAPGPTAVKPESGVERWVSPADLPPPKLVPKPVDGVMERRAHAQPTVPAGAKEIPYVEMAPEPAMTDAEKQRGYLLFGRPTVESV
jgi:hypothetical protein